MGGKFIFKELSDEEIFDILSLSETLPLTQSGEYGQWQKDLGREVRRFLIKKNNHEVGNTSNEIVGFFQLIKFDLPFGKNFIYSPHGPIIRIPPQNVSDQQKFLEELLYGLKKYLLEIYGSKDTAFIRLDFTLVGAPSAAPENNAIFKDHFKIPFKSTYHAAYLQPRAEWCLDITDSEENILKKMHEKTRYVINLAGRKGIQTEIIEKDFKKYFEEFYSLLHETAARNKFFLHSKKYYKCIFDRIEKSSGAFLSVAKYENKILVINLVQKFGDTANFIFGGGSSEQRNLSPSHRAHWAAIVHAITLVVL